MRASIAVVGIALIAACGSAPRDDGSRGDPGSLAAYLTSIPATDRAREVATWKLDRATWDRIIVEPYRAHYDAYAAAFEVAAQKLALDRPSGPGAITARPHLAGDPRLTAGQAWLRWAVPTLYPSVVAQQGGTAIDTVFVYDEPRRHWRALAGFEFVVVKLVRDFSGADGDCPAHLLDVTRSKGCAEIDFAIADAAFRSDRAAFDHACSLAGHLCR